MIIFATARKWLFRILQQLPTQQLFPKWKGFFFMPFFWKFAHSRPLLHANARPKTVILRKLQQKGGDHFMAFGQPNYGFLGNPGYQTGIYPQPIQPYTQRQETPSMIPQPGTIPARYVTGREEAVAAQIIPGDPFIFADFQHGRMYVKQLNPQTMAAEFVEFVRAQPAQQPQEAPAQPQAQFATLADLDTLRAELEALRTSMTPKQNNRKVVPADE